MAKWMTLLALGAFLVGISGCGEPEAEVGAGTSQDNTAVKFDDTKKENRGGMGTSPTTTE